MTNHGTRVILALPKMPDRQLRLMLALETVTPGSDGWREVGADLLARIANLSPNTAARARDELIKAARIEYKPGSGRGRVSAYRLKAPNGRGYLSGPEKVPSETDHLSEPERYPIEARKGTQSGPVKVPNQNALTCENENPALEASALEASALSPDERLLAEAVPGASEREIKHAIAKLRGRQADGEIRSVRAYLRAIIDCGDALALTTDARVTLTKSDAAAERTGPCAMCRIDDHEHCTEGRCTCQPGHMAAAS